MEKRKQAKLIKLDIADPEWIKLISKHPSATVFHHPSWIEFLCETYGYKSFIAAVSEGSTEITAGIPLIEVKAWPMGKKRLVGLPFTDFCPPLSVNEGERNKLIDALTSLRQEQKLREIFIHWPLLIKAGSYSAGDALWHTTSLKQDSDVLFRSFRKGVKSSIRQAQKENVNIREGQSWEDMQLFYDLHLRTRQRLGVPVQPIRFFKLLWDRLISNRYGFLLLAYKDSNLLASAVFLHWNRTLIYKYSASDRRFWMLRPNNILLWHAMLLGISKGYEVFDWGRTDTENVGLRTFKRGWASEEHVMNYSVMTDTAPTHSKVQLGRHLVERVIRQSPPWVCRLIGELFYKYAA